MFFREESQSLIQSSYIKHCKQEAITPNPASDWGCAFGLLKEQKKEIRLGTGGGCLGCKASVTAEVVKI